MEQERDCQRFFSRAAPGVTHDRVCFRIGSFLRSHAAMTRTQQLIAVLTLVLLAFFLNRLFCDWDSGYDYTGSPDFAGSRSRVILPLSESRGIVARTRESYVMDGIFGIGTPILLIGSSLFILATPPRPRGERTPLG